MAKERKDDTPAEDAKEKEVAMERDGKKIMVDPDAIEDYKERGWKMVKEEADKDEDEDEKDEKDEKDDDSDDDDDDEDDKEEMDESTLVAMAMEHKPQEFGDAVKAALMDRVRDAIDTQRDHVSASYLKNATTEE